MVDLKAEEQDMLTNLIASGTQRVRKVNHVRILLKAAEGPTSKSKHLWIWVLPPLYGSANDLWKKGWIRLWCHIERVEDMGI